MNATGNYELKIVAGDAALYQAAAKAIVDKIDTTFSEKNLFTIALSGGSAQHLYTLLTDDVSLRDRIPWANIHFFWGDERHVAPDHAESNFRMAYETMLSKIPVPPENIHRVHAEIADAEKAAAEYEQQIRSFFELQSGQIPRFDCVLLGMGPDGHTASLFPATAALHEKQRLVMANFVEKFQAYRITLTAHVINNAGIIIFVVSGENKAKTLKAVLKGEPQPELYPSQLIRPAHGKLLWLVEQSAAWPLSANK
jgi:6-phosphogluconolactonase